MALPGYTMGRAGRVFASILVGSIGVVAALALSAGSSRGASGAITGSGLCDIEDCSTLGVAADSSSLLHDNGTGTVSSSPSGIACVLGPPASYPGTETTSGTCSARFAWPLSEGPFTVTLSATGSAGSHSLGPYPDQLTLTLTNAVSAVLPYSFALEAESVAVAKSGAGTGSVTSNPSGIACGATCTTSVSYGTSMTLTAAPDAGASFLQWTGACAGQGAVCAVKPTSALSTDAVFGLAGQTTGLTTTAPATSTKTTTSTTVVTSTTTTTAPSTTTGGSAGSAGNHAVRLAAQLVAVKPARSKLGARLVEVELTTNERTTIVLSLSRRGKTLASVSIPAVRAGDRVLTLVVPVRVVKGSAVVHARVEPASGAAKTFQSSLTIPHP